MLAQYKHVVVEWSPTWCGGGGGYCEKSQGVLPYQNMILYQKVIPMGKYERVCPVCGKSFTSNHKRAVYDRAQCRVKASRGRQRLKGLSRSQKTLLKQIRQRSPVTAEHIENVISAHGVECADLVLKACLVAASERDNLVVSVA